MLQSMSNGSQIERSGISQLANGQWQPHGISACLEDQNNVAYGVLTGHPLFFTESS